MRVKDQDIFETTPNYLFKKTKLASHAPFLLFLFLFFPPLAEEQESIKRKVLLSNTLVPQNYFVSFPSSLSSLPAYAAIRPFLF